MPVDFLRTEEQIEMPIGVGFGAPAYIAQWAAGVYHSFWSEQVFPKDEYGWDIRLITKSGSFRYYFKNRAKAVIAYGETGSMYPNPPINWLWMTDTSTVLNWRGGDKEIGDVFGPILSRESGYKTMSKLAHKSRHELHMISLPAAVAAMANDWGYDNPGFPLEELQGAEDDTLWTDSFQQEMVGSEDIGVAGSTLWKRRAALWEALGENNPKKWQPIGSGVAKGKYDTTSEKLHKCLGILHSPWGGPIWAKVAFVWDPRADATFGESTRLTRPALVKIFANQAEAQAAADAELAAAGVTPSVPTSKPSAPVGGPALPEGYGEFREAWVEAMQGLKTEYGEKVPPPPVLAGELKRLLVTYDDVKAWWEVV